MTRWRIAAIHKTEIYIHPSLLVLVLYAGITGHGMVIAISLCSVILHEAAHAGAAALMGNTPSGIELTPLGAVMYLEDERRLSPLPRLLMLLSGPAATLMLCYLSLMLTRCNLLPVTAGRVIFASNAAILMLNLLPALPLDGGRILLLLLEKCHPIHAAHRAMRAIGCMLGLGLILLNIHVSRRLGGWNLSLSLAGCCLIYCAARCTASKAMVELRAFMDRKISLERRGCLNIQCCAALHTQSLRQLVKRLPARRMALYICFEAGTMKPLGMLTEPELIQLYLSAPGMRLSEALKEGQRWR